jgi:FtsP/CotA-like multicopper oxidase with cupredoxin domain
MDGPVGINQCAIKQGGNFTYRVPVDDQTGTFWYHAHSEVQRSDGLYGALIIHNPFTSPETLSYQYDEELLFLVGDWYHWPSQKVLDTFMSRDSLGKEV